MGALEIVLLVAAVALAVVSFVIPVKREEVSAGTKEMAKQEIKKMVTAEMDDIRSHVDEVVGEAMEYAVEKTERSLDRLTNEKIMAVNEYSDTVLSEIHKNHQEAMFLYDMLNAKHANIKNTVSEVTKTVHAVEETKREAQEVVKSFQQLKTEPVKEAEHIVNRTAQDTVSTEAAEKEWVMVGLRPNLLNEPAKEQPTLDTAGFPNRENGAVEADSAANNNERILALHRQGKSKVAIARELGLGVGEVKLVIDLYQNT